MSTTTIYKLGENAEEIGETRNGHRAAMYVWNQIAKDYFNLEYFPMFDEKMAGKVWNAKQKDGLSDDEVIVLNSTMDKAVVGKDGVNRAVEAFRNYGKSHPASSYSEQADLLSGSRLADGEYPFRHYRTLTNWHRNYPELFRVVIAGCVALKEKDE